MRDRILQVLSGLLVVFTFATVLQAQELDWAGAMGGLDWDPFGEAATDASGNVYAFGNFTHRADLDPGLGVHELTSAGGINAALVKLDSSGFFSWAVHFASSDTSTGVSVAVGAAGTPYLSGEFKGTVDFDPGPGTVERTSVEDMADPFVVNLDDAGNLLWAANFESTGWASTGSVAVDHENSVFVSGMFAGTVDFDPGPGVASLTSSHSTFLVKLDAEGNLIWVRAIGPGPGLFYGRRNLGVDAAGSVYLGGFFTDVTDFDPGPGVFSLSAGCVDAFVVKFDGDGNFVWASATKSPECPTDIGTGVQGHSIAVSASGRVLVVGDFSYVSDFDPGPGVVSMVTNYIGYDAWQVNGFLWALESDGSLAWAAQLESVTLEGGSSLSVGGFDTCERIYGVGSYSGPHDFDPGPGSSISTPSGGGGNFIWKLAANGNLVGVTLFHNSETSGFVKKSLAMTGDARLLLAGDFGGTADFDPGPGSYTLSPAGGWDWYVLSLTQSLGITLTLEPGRLRWDSGDCAGGYDVIRGDLTTLLVSGGDFGEATEACVEAGYLDQSLRFTESPEHGVGWWFLVRDSLGSYDSDSPSQITGRDAGVASSGLDCP